MIYLAWSFRIPVLSGSDLTQNAVKLFASIARTAIPNQWTPEKDRCEILLVGLDYSTKWIALPTEEDPPGQAQK
jgi:hypothetical protein